MRLVVTCAVLGGVALLGGCSGAHEPRMESSVPTRSAAPVKAVVDVPRLLPLSIDALAQRVGPRYPLPAEFEDPTTNQLARLGEPIDSVALFRPRDLPLVVSYDHQTRKVSDILVLGTDEDYLMQRAHFEASSPYYLLVPVFQSARPTQLLGLRIVPTAPNE